jgi:hypothetical protein
MMSMNIKVAAMLLALPMSTILVGCGGDEDSDREALDREALQNELELALQPDSMIEPELSDVALDDPTAEPDEQRSDPAPAQQPYTPPRRVEPRPSQPAPRPAPEPARPRTVTSPVPSGTTFAVRMNQELSTRTSSVGQTFTASLSEPLMGSDGRVLIPAGATVRGRVTESSVSGRVGQDTQLRVEFTSISSGGQTYTISATTLEADAQLSSRTSTARKAAQIGGGAVVGAVLGQVLGGNTKSTVAGAAIGAAAGTAVTKGTEDVDATIPAGARVTARLDRPVQVTRTVG